MPTKHNPTIRNVDTIKATLLRPATTSHFDVSIGLPRSSLGSQLTRVLGGTVQQDRLNIMCSQAVLPGSQLATTEILNDYTGATERHAYRRIYDETIDLTFYVDAGNYLPIIFFETWMNGIVNEDQDDAVSGNYNYRVKYPDDYVAEGLKVVKFEKSYHSQGNNVQSMARAAAGGVLGSFGGSLSRQGSGSSLEYTFVRSWPRSITSMPVTYEASQLLKCSVQMTYLRYVVHPYRGAGGGIGDPFQQSQFNFNGFLSQKAGDLVDAAVDRISGSDLAGDIAGGFAGQFASRALDRTGIGLLRR